MNALLVVKFYINSHVDILFLLLLFFYVSIFVQLVHFISCKYYIFFVNFVSTPCTRAVQRMLW